MTQGFGLKCSGSMDSDMENIPGVLTLLWRSCLLAGCSPSEWLQRSSLNIFPKGTEATQRGGTLKIQRIPMACPVHIVSLYITFHLSFKGTLTLGPLS